MQYRPEVDGLRTVAVVPVVLFHADIALFAGGFVGVDIFFVISGYLITTILISDIAQGRYSLLRFYERRARRILPALFLVTLCTIPAALAWLAPRELEDYAQSLVAVVTFSSNILFWAESGYFGGDAALKPLLHTWSLAVEEQYYILFPPMLYFLWRFGVPLLVVVLTALLLASFGLACWMVTVAPGAAFYLLPTRGWQLLAGALTAFFLYYRPAPGPGPVSQLAGCLGLGLIAWSVFTFDHHTPFPGLPALVPVAGCALLILFAVPGTLAQRMLAQPVFVGIGLISYSLYLWHQPLLAFAKYRSLGAPPPWVMLALCAASLPLAWATWRYVETPFRKGGQVSVRSLAGAGAAVAVLLGAVGLAGHQTNGFRDMILKYRVTEADRDLYQAIVAATEEHGGGRLDDGACRFGYARVTEEFLTRARACAQTHGPGVVVLGDSHAIDVSHGLAGSGALPFVIAVAQGGCRPYAAGPDCQYARFAEFAAREHGVIGAIVYHQAGSHFIADASGQVDTQTAFRGGGYSIQTGLIDAAADWLEGLAAQTEADVIWLGPFQEYRYRPEHATRSRVFLTHHPNAVPAFEDLEEALQIRLAGRTAFAYVPFDRVYSVPDVVYDGSCFHYSDFSHFSPCGEAAMSRSSGVTAFLQGIATQTP